MKEEKEYLTKEKFEELSKELENLKTVRRKEVAENLEYSKSLGDLSENAEYHEARDMQANVEDRISRLEAILKSASIVSSSKHGDSVGIGSKVTVQKEKEKDSNIYLIVGAEEADLTQNKISVRSPFGVAVLGKKKGDSFSFTTPKGQVNYKVLDIK